MYPSWKFLLSLFDRNPTKKYEALENPKELKRQFAEIFPEPPYYRWIGTNDQSPRLDRSEYQLFPAIVNIFTTYSSGIQTKNDGATIHDSRAAVWQTVQLISAKPINALGKEFPIAENGAWSLKAAKSDVKESGPSRNHISSILYRPFDWRWTYYTGRTGGVHARPRREVMQHMVVGGNIGLIFNRQIVGQVSHFGVSATLATHGTFYLGNKGQDYLAPLWIKTALSKIPSNPNFAVAFVRRLEFLVGLELRAESNERSKPTERGDLNKTFGARDALDWIYAVVHSPAYRSRYIEFLKSDFARIPLPKDRPVFKALIPLGTRLVALHLFDTNVASDLNDPPFRFAGAGRGGIPPTAGRSGYPRFTNGRVYINPERWFEEVPEATWEFHVGGYRVCEKWLKDRRGRTLSADDILHYRRVLHALNETRKLMTEIDKVIEAHGGWPGAFRGMEEQAVTA